MSEKILVVEGQTVSYEGYFNANDLYKLLDNFVLERGYDKDDKLHEVKVKEDGRYIDLDLRPVKRVSDYAKFVLQAKVTMSKVTDEEVEVDGHKIKINRGSVKITLNGHLVTDYEGDWKSNPRWVFFKTLYDKFIFKTAMDDYETMLAEDIKRLRNEISAFLNLHRYITGNHRL